MKHLFIALAAAAVICSGCQKSALKPEPQKEPARIPITLSTDIWTKATDDVVKDPYASTNTITAKRVDEDTYTAIVVPQMLTNKKPLLEIIFKDVSYMIESKFQFKTGTHHVLNVTLNNNPDKVKIEIGGEMGGWN
jgi:hypothetical protein